MVGLRRKILRIWRHLRESDEPMMADADIFTEYRPLLFSIAYRMLGSVADAEDIVQDTFLRWHALPTNEAVESPRAYLSTIVTRLCINHMHSARVQREMYVGPWLPEPLVTEHVPSVADTIEQRESLSVAFLLVLESLAPVERAVFLLRDVFDYEYAEIARIVEKSEANCRQMARRAREHIAQHQSRFTVPREISERLTQRFIAACLGGDMPGLLALLREDSVAVTDGGGKVTAARNRIYGADHIARAVLGVLKKLPQGMTYHAAEINGQPGFIWTLDEEPQGAIVLDIVEDHIHAVYLVVNPDKLRNL